MSSAQSINTLNVQIRPSFRGGLSFYGCLLFLSVGVRFNYFGGSVGTEFKASY